MTAGEPAAATTAATLVVGDRVLATLVAHSAVHTPGVQRLQPRALRAALTGVVRAGGRRGARGRSSGAPATQAREVDAVEVERTAGAVRATIAVVATDARPVVETVRDLHRRITDELARVAAVDAVVTVVVVDVVGDPATHR